MYLLVVQDEQLYYQKNSLLLGNAKAHKHAWSITNCLSPLLFILIHVCYACKILCSYVCIQLYTCKKILRGDMYAHTNFCFALPPRLYKGSPKVKHKTRI